MDNNMNYWGQTAKCVVILLTTETGVSSYELPDKTILNNNSKWVGVAVREPAGSRKTRSGADLINQAAFRAAHITLRSEVGEDYFREIPLETLVIKQADNWFFRLPLQTFDIANSKIFISDVSTIVNGEEIELMIFYDDENC